MCSANNLTKNKQHVKVVCLSMWYIRNSNPYEASGYLRYMIDNHRIKQNKQDTYRNYAYLHENNIIVDIEDLPPSYCPAVATGNSTARQLNDDLVSNFVDVQREIIALSEEYDGMQMIDIDEVQRQAFFKTAPNWKVIWVKFFDQWGPLSDKLPTLKRIIKKHKKTVLIHISIMEPGTILPIHEGISPAVIRYHLPIQIPKGDDVYLNLGGHKVNWVEGNGFVFDDCIPHGVVMKPEVNMKRIIIFADIPREYDDSSLAPLYENVSDFFHANIRKNQKIQDIKDHIVEHQTKEINT